jgi:hypothetical protein
MEKKFNLLFSFIILSLLTFSFVSAEQFNFDYAKEQVNMGINFVLGMAAPAFEMIIGDYATSEFFFSKILVLLLLVIIIKNVLDKARIFEDSDNKKVSLIISLILSILSIRFISQNDFFESIFIQYGVLGIAITTILPMVIFFYFIHNTKVGTFGRKMFWGIYAVILFVLWVSKSSELPEAANWIYFLTFGLAVVFILMDKSIHGYFGVSDFFDFQKKLNRERMRVLKRKLVEMDRDYKNGVFRGQESEYREESRELEREIKRLSREG